MFKLNFLLYPNVQDIHITTDYSLSILDNNDSFTLLKKVFLKKYNFTDLKTIDFSKYGVLGLMLELDGKIAVSKGESQSIVDAAKQYEKLGFEVLWIELNKNGTVNFEKLKDQKLDFIFISSYTMDTFVKTNLKKIKELTNAKIISNSSANYDEICDIAIFDCYKLSGYTSSAIVLHNGEFEEQNLANCDALSVYLSFEGLKNQTFNTSNKKLFLEKLKQKFKDDIYFFVEPSSTLDYSLHFALKNIKARELIRTSALSNILITNGEGCSLGLSKPSRIIQSMGYDELTSRNAISLSFCEEYSNEEIEKIVELLHKKYRQIKVLNEQ
ncbi:cysteine desulfurase [Arcobacter sp. CECT 8985]|uniref:cysteine desulfurase n=1 Tax=Arcobacter sp. CECT 8985 TaxID=1935424 RepID=UPI00100C1D72|nr:cysteine desulfurase [Arcobacter sp. CECT 8985]RXJ88248.1 cysteine desulfurase [Arcobacter sp. CECT 8985]